MVKADIFDSLTARLRGRKAVTMSQKSLVALYNSQAAVNAAVHSLHDGGFPPDQVNVIRQDLQHATAYATLADVVLDGFIAGALAGSILGALIGVLLIGRQVSGDLSVFSALLPVLIGSAAGAAIGAVSGCVAGVLLGWFVHEEHIPRRATESDRTYLLVVRGDETEIKRAQHILSGTTARESIIYNTETTSIRVPDGEDTSTVNGF